MITKTYLDGKLNQLEEKIKRTIDVKDNRQTEELSAEIKELRNTVKLLEEKVAENRDVLENYLREHNNLKKSNGLRENVEELKSEPEELKQPIENFQETKDKEGAEERNKNDDAITSDI